MFRSHLGLAAIIAAVLVASCGGRPSVTVRVAGETVPTQVVSSTEGTPCSATHGDAFGPPPQIMIVRASTPLSIRVDTEPGTRVSGWIYDLDAPTATGGPVEEFSLTNGETYQSRSIVAERTYDIMVNVFRSMLGMSTEVTHTFRLRVQPP